MSRIIRVTRNPTTSSSDVAGETCAAFNAAPDEATLPTIDWCVAHGLQAHEARYAGFVCDEAPIDYGEECRVVTVPLPVHLGVEVTP